MAFVTGALSSVIPKLALLLKEEYDLQKSVRKKITSLSRDLENMHAALLKVGGVPADQLDDNVKLWARDVRELSYEVENVIDCFLVRVDGREACDANRFKRTMKKIGKLFSKSKVRHQIGGMIKIINEQAKELEVRRDRYKVDEIVAKRAPMSTVDPRLEAIYKDVKELVGIGKSSDELISMLSLQRDGESENKMKMVSVVGVGGLGKTPLVKAVYDKLKVYFECTAFVPIGQNPDLRKVFRDIIIGLDKKKYTDLKFTVWDERQLIDELREYLQSKRYFIVIDDVWKTETWKTIKWAFIGNNKNGSRLITTTHISDVAAQADEVYRLQPLPFEESRKLFYTRIFGVEGKCPDNQLDGITDKILKKCDGVPLAIITMASLLLGKSKGQWIEVCNSIGFRDTMQILSLSYYDLPPHLKTCLLYLSAFLEDYEVHKNSLIWKWVAEGFVQKEERRGFFEVGEGYFNELINRSLIMALEFESEVVGCRVHDMVLDLLQQISQEDNFMIIPDSDGTMTIPSSGRVRRLAHQNKAVESTHQDRHMDLLGHLKSLIACICDYKALPLARFKLLRVLALERCKSGEGLIRLEHLESLIHLRYLRLTRTRIDELPEGIGALKFLQTLDVEDTEIKELPSSIGQLTHLICLYAGTARVPNKVIAKLTSMEDLMIFYHMDTAGQLVGELGNLSELRVLNVVLNDTEGAMQQSNFVESLGKLHKIQYLLLNGYIRDIDQDLWKALVLPPSLQYLRLAAPKFNALPTSCINPSALPNLLHLSLIVRNMDELSLKCLGRLPELRYLILTTYCTLTLTIHSADGCFQKLRSLSLPQSMVRFVPNEDSSVPFTVGYEQHDVAASTEMRDDAPAVMPNLEMLHFQVNEHELMGDNGSCDNLGLECLHSLQKVDVTFQCWGDSVDDVEKKEATVRRAIEVHPNRPTLRIIFCGEPRHRLTLKFSVQPEPDERDDDDEVASHFEARITTALREGPRVSTAARLRGWRMRRRRGASSSLVPGVSRDSSSSAAFPTLETR